MLGVDEGSNAAGLLALSDGMDGQRRLTARLGAVNLDDTSLRVATHSQCGIQADGTSGNDINVLYLFVAHAHDAALAEILFNLRHGGLQGFQFLLLRIQGLALILFLCHN